LEKQIKKYSFHIKGKVLDVGAGSFSRYIDHFDCEEYIKMDIHGEKNIDIVGNAENIPFRSETFDSIVCTQVISDLENPGKAIKEFYRVLKPGGKVLLTESLFNEMHDEPYDFWRFTKFGLEKFFQEAGFRVIAIDRRGGFFAMMGQNTIRYLIERFNLYSHRWTKIIKPIISLYGRKMIFLDKLDKSKANKKFSIGWCILGEK